MKKEDLFEAIGHVDDRLLEHSEASISKRTKGIWIKWGALAACLCLVLYIGIWYIPAHTAETAPGAEKLPMLEARFDSDGMGFEGLMFYSISESGSANPWTEEVSLTTLPVYRNLAYVDASGIPLYLSEGEMLKLAEKTAAALDTTIEEINYDKISPEQLPQDTTLSGGETYRLAAMSDVGEIVVSGNGTVSIFFAEAVQIPEEYSFTYSNTSDSDAVSVTSYLLERFSRLYSLENPVINTWGDYTFSGEQTRRYSAYSNSGGPGQRILNYNFHNVYFSPDIDGALSSISFANILSSSEKIGEYPLITPESARELLLGGKYISTVPEEYLPEGVVTGEYIAKVELIYRTGNIDKIFMPYYRFYVELSEFAAAEQTDGLKCYGAYYVPAVKGEYLSDFPSWDGSFN